MEDSLWERYGVGQDPRCSSCMMHSGFEAGIIQESFTNPIEAGRLAGSFLRNGNGDQRLEDHDFEAEDMLIELEAVETIKEE